MNMIRPSVRRLRCGLLQLMLCLSLGVSGASLPFYAEIYLPRARELQRDTLPAGLLQLFEVKPDFGRICFEADLMALRDTLPRSLFFKLDRRSRLTARWISKGDTLLSKPFVLTRLRSDVVVLAAPDQLRVQHVRYFLPRYRGRASVVLAAGAAAWAVKLLVAWLVLCFLRKPRRILCWAAPLFAVTTFLCHSAPMNLFSMLLLPMVIETAVLWCCCRNDMRVREIFVFVVLAQVCSFGLIHLGCQLPVFM